MASIVCPGGQGDVSIYGNLLFMSVEQTRGRLDCGVQGVTAPVSVERFRGVRIFDISDLKNPKQVAAVQTCRGSHTHTLVPDTRDPSAIYLYGSGTSTVRSGEELAGCSGLDPKEDPNTALFSIDVIKVPLKNPEQAAIVARPRIFADVATGNLAGLWQGGNHGEGTQTSRMTNQCHDITVFSDIGLAAGACSGNGILMDISDPQNPKRLDAVTDKGFAYWHSATFNNDGTKVVFTDEWGGGSRPRCRATDPITWGADAIYDVVDRKLVFKGYYKMPAPQGDTENCVAHNGSLVPVPGRDIMVQSWYQGGISVFDFTDSTKPVEIAFFDRGPDQPDRAGDRRLLVVLLVQRPHLRRRDLARHRRLPAAAERTPDRERDRRRQPGALPGVQLAEPADLRVAAELRRGQGLSRPARTRQGDRAGPGQNAARGARSGRQAARRPRSTSSTRWPRIWNATRPAPPRPTPSATRRWPRPSRPARRGCGDASAAARPRARAVVPASASGAEAVGAAPVLVVAATAAELAPAEGWRTLCCGVGPVDAAAVTAAALAAERPLAVLHVGIAGARRASALVPPAVVVGIASIYGDLGVPEQWAPRRLAAPADLVAAACRAVPGACRLVIGTSGRVGHTVDCPVEAMEGFAVLRAAALAGVPAIEVRVISNAIEEGDRAKWQFDEAFAVVRAITPALVQELATCRR